MLRKYFLVSFLRLHSGQVLPCLLVLILLTGCSSIRPIYKIGLIAPFEGLYRRNGYEALDAMRAAIAETPHTGIDLLPLALDDSIDPQRTARKMLADPTLKAVIGPLSAESWGVTHQDFVVANVPWILPFAISVEDGFFDLADESAWAIPFARVIVQTIQESGKTQLIIAGQVAGGSTYSQQAWSEITNFDIKLLDYKQTNALKMVDNEAVILWLGSAAEGAQFANQVWAAYPNVTFWTGPQGEDPVFREGLSEHGTLYWATWSDEHYSEWAKMHQPASFAAYRTYLATRTAILQMMSPSQVVEKTPWFVQCFRVDSERANLPLDCH